MTEFQTSLGAYLRTEREMRGMSLSELAAETRVPETTLQHIEADRFDDLPGEVFVRGFLRAYARAVELDPDRILELLDRPAPSPTLPLLPPPSFSLRRRRLATPALVLVLLLAVALITLILWRPMAGPSISATVPTPFVGTTG